MTMSAMRLSTTHCHCSCIIHAIVLFTMSIELHQHSALLTLASLMCVVEDSVLLCRVSVKSQLKRSGVGQLHSSTQGPRLTACQREGMH